MSRQQVNLAKIMKAKSGNQMRMSAARASREPPKRVHIKKDVSDYIVRKVIANKNVLLNHNGSRDARSNQRRERAWQDIVLDISEVHGVQLTVESVKGHYSYRRSKEMEVDAADRRSRSRTGCGPVEQTSRDRDEMDDEASSLLREMYRGTASYDGISSDFQLETNVGREMAISGQDEYLMQQRSDDEDFELSNTIPGAGEYDDDIYEENISQHQLRGVTDTPPFTTSFHRDPSVETNKRQKRRGLSDDDIRQVHIENMLEQTALLKEQRQFYSHMIIFLKQVARQTETVDSVDRTAEKQKNEKQRQDLGDPNLDTTEAATSICVD